MPDAATTRRDGRRKSDRRPPARATKRKLTLTEAADQWEKAKRQMDKLKPLLEEAAPVLLEHFERTGRSSYDDRIALTGGGTSLVLDQPKVREFLGRRLGEFQRRVERRPSLTLLK